MNEWTNESMNESYKYVLCRPREEEVNAHTHHKHRGVTGRGVREKQGRTGRHRESLHLPNKGGHCRAWSPARWHGLSQAWRRRQACIRDFVSRYFPELILGEGGESIKVLSACMGGRVAERRGSEWCSTWATSLARWGSCVQR